MAGRTEPIGSLTESERVTAARKFAHQIHRGQARKGSLVPYITHPLAVAALVKQHGGNETLVIAALLHDCVEDGEGLATLDAIRSEFGDAVADIVWGCSDAHTDPKPPWRPRKEAFIQKVRSACPDVKLIVAADKFHNIQSLMAELEFRGAGVWSAFKGGRDGTLWYYRAITDALAERWEHALLRDLAAGVDTLRATSEG